MAGNFTLRVITPERIALDTTVDAVKIYGGDLQPLATDGPQCGIDPGLVFG